MREYPFYVLFFVLALFSTATLLRQATRAHQRGKTARFAGFGPLCRVCVLAAQVGIALAAVIAAVILAVLSKNLFATAFACLFGLFLVAVAARVGYKLVHWQASIWVRSYLFQKRESFDPSKHLDICFLFVDHFEPDWNQAADAKQVERVQGWEAAYAEAVFDHTDSDGRCPQHTWFSPVALTSPAAMSVLSTWPARGWGEIEYHLHHDHAPAMPREQIRAQILQDIRALQGYGAVPSGRYAFVHGMCALAGGDPQYCQVADEIDVLIETGCYADFTFPAIGTAAQPRQVNSLYYASSNGKAKSYDTGPAAQVGTTHAGLLMIPGPMWLGLSRRVLDDAEVAMNFPPHPRRIARWLDAHVHVRGRPNWVFIGVHSHTAVEGTRDLLFGGGIQAAWSSLESRFKNERTRLHYVTAREAYNIIKAAEAGFDDNPNDYRDYQIPAPRAYREPEHRRNAFGAG